MDYRILKLVNPVELHAKDPNMGLSILFYYYNKLVEDNLLKKLFYDGTITTWDDFRLFFLDKYIISYIIYSIELARPIAHIHFTSFEGYSARVHFSVLKEFHGTGVDKLAIEVFSKFFSEKKRVDGTPIATSLIGVTPTSNRLAIRTLKLSGFQPQFVVPQACFQAYARTPYYDSGLVSMMTIESLGIARDRLNRLVS